MRVLKIATNIAILLSLTACVQQHDAKGIVKVIQLGDQTFTFIPILHAATTEFRLPSAIADALDGSELVLVEVDVSDPELSAVRASCMDELIRSAPKVNIGAELRSKVDSVALQNGINLTSHANAHPATLLSAVAAKGLTEWKSQYGLDLQAVRASKRMGKEVRALETVCESMEMTVRPLFDLFSDSLLSEMLDSLPDQHGEKHLRELQNAWVTGEPEVAREAYFALQKKYPLQYELHRKMLRQRNALLLSRILRTTGKQKKIAVVVGMDHVLMPASLIDDFLSAGGKHTP
jgi:uncharacterized protein YbaP (TraB family)